MIATIDTRTGPTELSPDATAFHAVHCGDGKPRCPWAVASPGALADHDVAWCLPPATAYEYFEALCLEIFDSGLARWSQSGRHPSWYLYMNGLNPRQVARLDADDVEDLLLNPELIRNRTKVEAVIHNARVCQDWDILRWHELIAQAAIPAPERSPASALHMPQCTPEAKNLSLLLRQQGFRLVGPVTAYRWLQRTAHVPGHVSGCFREADDMAAP